MELLKWMLYALVLGTSTTIGFLFSQKYQKRVEELKDFKSAFTIFKTKIRFTYAPLRDIFDDISNSISSKTALVFKNAIKYMEQENATDSWNRAVQETELNITKEDKESICSLGKLLGKTDLEGQMNEIDLSLTFLETQIEKAEKEKEKNAKLYRTLGTITGIGKVLKEENPDVQIIAVEPESSQTLGKGVKGPHKIQGIGAGFVPSIYDSDIIDEIIPVKDEDAGNTLLDLAKKEGIFAGISSGAATWAAIQVAKRDENKGKRILAILPDDGSRYLSVDWLFE